MVAGWLADRVPRRLRRSARRRAVRDGCRRRGRGAAHRQHRRGLGRSVVAGRFGHRVRAGRADRDHGSGWWRCRARHSRLDARIRSSLVDRRSPRVRRPHVRCDPRGSVHHRCGWVRAASRHAYPEDRSRTVVVAAWSMARLHHHPGASGERRRSHVDQQDPAERSEPRASQRGRVAAGRIARLALSSRRRRRARTRPCGRGAIPARA